MALQPGAPLLLSIGPSTPAEIDANLPSVAIFIPRWETWAFDKDAAS